MIFCLCACGEQQGTPATTTAGITVPATEATDTVQTDAPTEAPTESPNVLVAYFSATHTTQDIAEKLANGLGADLYEIVPVEPYTSADLDYSDNSSRTTLETNDPPARPAISCSVENM